jgi:putative oxygen-independent coproporphyrinogen III oxidase
MSDPGFGLYIHWPFCPSKCPYCDFNSHVREAVPEQAWRDALLKDLEHVAALTPGRTVTSIFFGGGTPSLMAPETVAAVLNGVMALWPVDQEAEVTLEANPGTADAGRFRGYRSAGVNRLSIGVQSFDDAALHFLGRAHDAAAARRAVEMAAAAFDRFSFDLIYARPGQTPEDWQLELGHALDLAAGHLSLYQLTIEEGTAFHTAWRLGELVMPSENMVADMFEETQAVMNRAGLPAYEISNHAAPGQESRHNLVYWRYGDYAGVGPGAHGRLTLESGRRATFQHRLPEAWLSAVSESGHGQKETNPIDPGDQATEMLLMGLRLREGVPLARLETISGQRFDEVIEPARLAQMVDGGFLTVESGRLQATPEGRQRLNAVLASLLA